jgi:prephenate dehydrogenase
LYQGKVAIITPTLATPAGATAVVEELWHAAGCRLIRLAPDQHDRLVAEASHLPHVLAAAVAMDLSAAAAPLAATGFRDTTRVAAGSPEIWAEILLANHDAVTRGIARAQQHLDDLKTAIASGDQTAVERWLAAGGAGRARFEAAQPPAASGTKP